MALEDVALTGPWRAAAADEALRRDYVADGFDDGAWETLDVPGHWRSAPAFAETDGPLLYRRAFDSPDPVGDHGPRTRSWLVLDGIFYTGDVWLDGAYLGDTEGYFFPHAFEVTEHLRERSSHVLGLEVGCPRPADRRAKRALTGVFQHWDQLDQTWNPGGIWRPVHLEQTGPVRIRHFRAVCREATEASATVFVRAVLDAAEPCTVSVTTGIAPAAPGRPSGRPADEEERVEMTRTLARGENRLEWTVTVSDPRRWWPRSLGDQPLYDLTCRVHVGDDPDDAPVSDQRHRRLGLRSVSWHDWVFSVNGERLFLKGANQGPSRMALGEAFDAELAGDVGLAVEAGLDFLRVHAHISRPALYEAADEAGLLVWQDLPLQWGYARSVRDQARRQAREAVDLLGHHPSVIVWCGHNEPFALDITPQAMAEPRRRARLAAAALASTVLPTWNKTVLDHSIKRVLQASDGSRPVVAHSGVFPHPPLLDGTDTHTYFGWYHGRFRDVPRFLAAWPRAARFVSEFGAQAVPHGADFLAPDRWPDLDWDRAWQRHGLQKTFFDEHVPPAGSSTFDEWATATQTYQADLIRCHVEALRRIKYRPCGGFAQFSFADGFPSVSWSVLDHQRRPKLGLEALRAACEPVIVVADWLPDHLHPRQPIELAVHVVNDRRITLDDMVVSAYLSWREDADPDGLGTGEQGQHQWQWTGGVGADDVAFVGTISALAPPGPGRVAVDLELRDGPGGEIMARNHYASVVVAGAHPH